MLDLRRRQFITLLGVATPSVAARAEPWALAYHIVMAMPPDTRAVTVGSAH